MATPIDQEGLELARKINLKLGEIRERIGLLSTLTTTDKTSLVAAINELTAVVAEGGGGSEITVANGMACSEDSEGNPIFWPVFATNPNL